MTVSTDESTISYTANGFVFSFSYPFLAYDASHLFVYIDNVLQTIGYTVTGIGDDSGGDVVFDAAPADGSIVRIDRDVPVTQEIVYQEYGPFPAKTTERGLDLGVMIDQQIQRDTARALETVDQIAEEKMDKQPAASENNFVSFDDEGNSKDSGFSVNDINGQVAIQQPRQFGDGVSTIFSTPAGQAANPVEFVVRVDGLYQRANTDYSVPAINQIEFSVAPANLSNVDILWYKPINGVTDPTLINVNIDGVELNIEEAINNLSVSDYAELKTLDSSNVASNKTTNVAYRETPFDDAGGSFYFNDSDLSAQVANDPLEGRFVAPFTDPSGATGAHVRVDNKFIYAAHYGISTENTATVNNAIFLSLLQKVNDEGGFIVFGAGNFELGDVRFTFDSSGESFPDNRAKGIVGAGVGVTNLYFDTPAGETVFNQSGIIYWITMKDFTAQSNLWGGSDPLVKGVTDFIRFEDGAPRTYIENIKVTGWRVGIWIDCWVSVIKHVEAYECAYSLIHVGGTSTHIDNYYAHNCFYGHSLGVKPFNLIDNPINDTIWIGEGTQYCTYTSLSCDRAQKAAYVIGGVRGGLANCGAEILFSTGGNNPLGYILFPVLHDEAGAVLSPQPSTVMCKVDEFTVFTNITAIGSGKGVIQVDRDNVRGTIGNIYISGDNSQRKILTIDPSVTICNLNFVGQYAGKWLNDLDSGTANVAGLRFNDDFVGNIILYNEAWLQFSPSGGQMFKRFDGTFPRIDGDQKMFFAVKGTQFQDSATLVKLDIIDYATQFSARNTFIGSVVVRAIWDDVNGPEAQIHASGNFPADITVAINASTKNVSPGVGFDVEVGFTGDSGFANNRFCAIYEINTSAEFAIEEDTERWIAWVE